MKDRFLGGICLTFLQIREVYIKKIVHPFSAPSKQPNINRIVNLWSFHLKIQCKSFLLFKDNISEYYFRAHHSLKNFPLFAFISFSRTTHISIFSLSSWYSEFTRNSRNNIFVELCSWRHALIHFPPKKSFVVVDMFFFFENQ